MRRTQRREGRGGGKVERRQAGGTNGAWIETELEGRGSNCEGETWPEAPRRRRL